MVFTKMLSLRVDKIKIFKNRARNKKIMTYNKAEIIKNPPDEVNLEFNIFEPGENHSLEDFIYYFAIFTFREYSTGSR